MRLGLSAILKGAFSRRPKERKQEKAKIQQADHAYIKGQNVHRGPCPGLNALANHGFLPRDGDGVTLPRVEAALMTALQMSGPLAHALASALGPLCREDGTFSLADMHRSPVEQEAAPSRFAVHDASFFRALLTGKKDETVSVKTVARTHRKQKKQQKAVGAPKAPRKQRVASLIQAVSVLHAAGVGGIGGKLPVEIMAVLEAEERLLEAVFRNRRKRTLMGLVLKAVTLYILILVRVRADKR